MADLYTYDDTVRRESLLDVLRDVSPVTDNYLVNELGTSVATNTLHEWPVFNIARATSVTAQAEGFAFSTDDNPQPTRSQNITEIVKYAVQITGTELAVDPAGMGDVMTFQKTNALKRLKQFMEYELLNGTGLTSGASGTARAMAKLAKLLRRKTLKDNRNNNSGHLKSR